MTTQALFQQLDTLSRADKLKAIQHLVISLAREEDIELPTYELWSPLVSDEALHNLMEFAKARKAERERSNNE